MKTQDIAIIIPTLGRPQHLWPLFTNIFETTKEAKDAVESMYSIEYPYVPDKRIRYEKTIEISAEVL
jgi:hypothetical protein